MTSSRASLAVSIALCAACSGEGDSAAPSGAAGSHGVTQGGPQDIGRFREIVAQGGIPSPDTLDPVGFFAEHALDLPPADCGQVLCVHPMLGVASRFNRTNWTMAFVALSTPIDPESLPRPALHVVVALERTVRTEPEWADIVAGVRAMAASLRPDDLVSLVVYRETAEILAAELAPDDPGLERALTEAGAGPAGQRSALYDALATAGQARGNGASRIVLVTSGIADAGVADQSRVEAIGEGLVREGTSLTIVGAGEPFDARLPVALSELGAGAYYHPEDSGAFQEVFRNEAATTLSPLATAFQLQVTPAAGYRVGRVYGTRRFVTQAGIASLAIPALFVGRREGADDVGGGRRGGGGALFVELLPEPGAMETIAAGEAAFRVDASWIDPVTGQEGGTNAAVMNPLRPGEVPADMNAWFSDETRQKAFWMLNDYLALRTAVDFQDVGDCARAKGVIDMVQPFVETFLLSSPDADLEADLDLIRDLRGNLEDACITTVPLRPQDFYGGCYAS